MAKAQVGALPKSKNVYVDAITWGGNRWDQKTGPVTFAFDNGSGEAGELPWQRADKSAFKLAFSLFSGFADIAFSEIANPAAANLRFHKVDNRFEDMKGFLAIQTGPNGEAEDGEGYYNVAEHTDWAGQLNQGGYAFVTVIHELGHALGLAHPHDDGGGSGLFPGVDGYDASGGPLLDADGELDPAQDVGDNGLNVGLYTMMSYNDLTQPFTPGREGDYGFEGTPMAFDIAALQRLYGANTRFHTGADTYRLPGSDKAGTFWSAIWDAGGIDTISAEGVRRDVTIDLRAAPLTGAHAGGYASGVTGFGVHGGFTIANGVTIENAVGGSGNDTLTGNDAANVLDGRGGIDTLTGGRGNDTYGIDDARDRVIEARGGGQDTIVSKVSYALAEGQEVETLQLASTTGRAGLDLTGNAFANTLRGNGGANVLDGAGGADQLYGKAGDDVYAVDRASDRVHEAVGQGRDTVVATASYALAAGQEVETLQLARSTGDRALKLTGNEFANALRGNGGGNTLNGLSGADVLTGKGGADTFVFSTKLGAGNVDRIADFASEDTIRLEDGIFSALKTGVLAQDAFKNISTGKADADDHILYKQATGQLFYDADGDGKAAAVLFATLDNKAALTAADVFIV